MPASALLGNELSFKYEDPVTPDSYIAFSAAIDFGEFGEEKPLVDITTLASTAREYRNGLADGMEIPLQANFTANDAQWQIFKDAYDDDTLMSFQIDVDGATPAFGFQFNATVRAWSVSAPPGEKSTTRFTLKISGPVTLL